MQEGSESKSRVFGAIKKAFFWFAKYAIVFGAGWLACLSQEGYQIPCLKSLQDCTVYIEQKK